MGVKHPLWIYIDALLDDFPDEYAEGIVDDAAKFLCKRIEGLSFERYSIGVQLQFKYPRKTYWRPDLYTSGDLYGWFAVGSPENPEGREAWKFLLSSFVANLISPKMNKYRFEFYDIVKGEKGKIL